MATGNPTRARIVEAAVSLFAKQGFKATTIDDIAATAGLSTRSGALYKHFPSKRAILEAAFEEHARSVEAMEGVLDLLPLGDIRTELTLLARWAMQELRREQDFLRILQRERETFPDLAEAMRDRIVRRGYAQGTALFERHFGSSEVAGLDAAATAAIALGAIVNYRQAELDYGEPPGLVDEERFISTWVNLLALAAQTANAEAPGHRSSAASRAPRQRKKPK